MAVGYERKYMAALLVTNAETIAAMAAVGNEGTDDARLAAGRLRDPHDGGKVALEIAAGNTEAGSEVRPRSNAGIELERRHDLAPVGADALGKLRQGVGGADRGHQAAVDRDFGELRAFVSHRQDRAADDISLRARRALGRGAIAVVISDGWDRGDPALLAVEMAHLQRSCHLLVWLNPLLGLDGYQPLTRGMSAALPYVDLFLPAHNLRSLEALASLLGRLSDERPARRAPKPLTRAV